MKIVLTGIQEAIRALRRERGWTQRQLAAELGKTVPTVSHWEQNVYQPPPDTLLRLAALAQDMEIAEYFRSTAGGTAEPPETLSRENAGTRRYLDHILTRAPNAMRRSLRERIVTLHDKYCGCDTRQQEGEPNNEQKSKLPGAAGARRAAARR